jgi:ElaB/YqjD/DUF883 family membrane-anchored ribosome-binding protein
VPAARTAPETETAVDTPAALPAQQPAPGEDQDGLVPAAAEVAELLAAAVAAVSPEPAAAEDLPQRPEQPDTGDEAMGLMDNLKGKAEELAEELKEKAGQLAGQHNEKIDELVDKTGEVVDKATHGRYSEQIASRAEKAKGAVDGFAEKAKQGKEGSEQAPAAEAAAETEQPPSDDQPEQK